MFVNSSYNMGLQSNASNHPITLCARVFLNLTYIKQLLDSVVLDVFGDLLYLALVLLVDAQVLDQSFSVHFIFKTIYN